VSLLSQIGVCGTYAGDLFNPSKLSEIALSRLSWNFLDCGRNAAAVSGAEAGRDAVLADYRAQVLAVLQYAEGALHRCGAVRTVFSRSVDEHRHVAEIARLQIMRATARAGSPIEAK
jgi:outer membrane protein TolC